MLLAALCVTPLPYQQTIIHDPASVLFFTLGMAFAASHISLDGLYRHRVPFTLLTLASMVLIVLAVVTPLMAWMPPLARSILMNVAILVEQFSFIMAALAWAANRADENSLKTDSRSECKPCRWGERLRLAESSFFIFCMHPFVSSAFMNIAKRDLPLFHDSSLSILFVLLSVVVTVAICLMAFHVMRRCFPQLLSLLTGSRI